MMAGRLGRWLVGDGFGLCGFKDRKFKVVVELDCRVETPGGVSRPLTEKFVKK